MSDIAITLKAFESLGDNCEFGLLQRKYGYDSAGLFRWSNTNPDSLIKILDQDFCDLYNFDHIVPAYDDMINDNIYGISFHSKMKSELRNGKRVFVLSKEQMKTIYEEELSKILYKVSKIRKQLKDADKIFVYKQKETLPGITIEKLHCALKSYNPQNILLFVGLNEMAPGTVWAEKPGLLMASIDRFSPYEKPEEYSDMWLDICKAVQNLRL